MLPRNFTLLLLVPLVLLVFGTTGYYVLEDDFTFFDAFYMTTITLTTVGYGEVPHELSLKGRVFTVFLLLGGVFTIFWVAGELIRVIISGEVQNALGRRRMQRNLSAMKDHFIVCGYGRMGRHVCWQFSTQGLPFVIIDKDEDLMNEVDLPHAIPLVGDATADEVLRKAGIERARALVTVAGTDTDNLFITLSSRLINPNLYVVARAEGEQTVDKLKRVGANRVVAPYALGGASIAQAVLRPNVVEFIDLATRSEHLELQIEEVRIEQGSTLIDVPIMDTMLHKKHGIFIIAIKKKSGQMVYNPPGHGQLELLDTLIVLGHREELDYLKRVAHVKTHLIPDFPDTRSREQ